MRFKTLREEKEELEGKEKLKRKSWFAYHENVKYEKGIRPAIYM